MRSHSPLLASEPQPGLAALEEFFAAMPPDTDSGMAFVPVQHRDPDHKSILIDLVKRYTRMETFKVEDGMHMKPDCLCVIPPNKDMSLLVGKLYLMHPSSPRGLRLPIDYFSRSRAMDQRERAICIMLSSTGTGGTLGLKAVTDGGGVAMVQQPESDGYDGMPRSAIATGLVDVILPPEEMPGQLISYEHRALNRMLPPPFAPASTDDLLQKVIILLRTTTGHDFSEHKEPTILRRVQMRMSITKTDSMSDYISYLQRHPAEVAMLFRELLIGITNFFREPEAFELIKTEVITKLLEARLAGGGVRVWVPACATGEEAYSLAILLHEQVSKLRQKIQVQVFVTDINSDAIEKARAALYPESIAADVSEDPLARFFAKEGSSYCILKNVRDIMVFATYDITKDPPFSKMDLISCRNLLIHLEPQLQTQIIAMFYYALNQYGYLCLGSSEAASAFTLVDTRFKVYRRGTGAAPPKAVAQYFTPVRTGRRPTAVARPLATRAGFRELAERAMLDQYMTACVFINAQYDVLYVHGHTRKYLEPARGEASLNLVSMIREELKPQFTVAVHRANALGKPVRYDRVLFRTNGDTTAANIIVHPLTAPETAEPLFMIVFEETAEQTVPVPAADGEKVAASNKGLQVANLQHELMVKRECLQTAVEELESSREERMSLSQEMLSFNEELQSTNEELLTFKGELQAGNEEPVTVNTRLQKKNEELISVNDDISILLAVTDSGTIFPDMKLNIQRFTPVAAQVINLIPTDVGRPLEHIAARLVGYDNLVQDMADVLNTLKPKEAEVRTSGQWCLMRI